MYKRFFGLHHLPFSIAPDPRYLFMSERHREALAHLLYGLDGGGGFVLLTGEIGAGKTTVCRLFLEQIPTSCNIAYIFNPKQTVIELLQSICDEFGIVAGEDRASPATNMAMPAAAIGAATYAAGAPWLPMHDGGRAVPQQRAALEPAGAAEPGDAESSIAGSSTAIAPTPAARQTIAGHGRNRTVKDFIDPLNAFLLNAHARDENNILIIDEAQNLSADVLEQLRLLTNLETNERKLLQIILIGQPELRSMLARPELEQLAQRVIARFHLAALSESETAAYIAHRLAVAGSERAMPFGPRILRRIHALTGGIPRRINLLCDRAMLGAYAAGKTDVDTATIDAAAREVFDAGQFPRRSGRPLPWLPMAVASAATVLLFGVLTRAGLFLPRQAASASIVGAATVGKRLADGGAAATPGAASVQAGTGHLAPSGSRAGAPVNGSASPSQRLPESGTGKSTGAGAADAVGTGAALDMTGAPAPLPGNEVRDPGVAYRQLGQLWKVTVGAGDFCQLAKLQQLYCFSGRSGLSEIGGLGRPGIMTLHDDQDQKYYALLVGLTDHAAMLHIGARTDVVGLQALARRWHGDFTTLWHGPAGLEHNIVMGERGPVVSWLAAGLAAVDHGPAPQATQAFDAALAARVRQFQLAQGLAPDGLPGRQTLMRLASVSDPNGPRLRTVFATSAPAASQTSAPGALPASARAGVAAPKMPAADDKTGRPAASPSRK